MLVVRNSFKSKGICYEVGSIIEDPTDITLFNTRISNRDILDLPNDPHTITWIDYLEGRVASLDPRIYEACGIEKPEKNPYGLVPPEPVVDTNDQKEDAGKTAQEENTEPPKEEAKAATDLTDKQEIANIEPSAKDVPPTGTKNQEQAKVVSAEVPKKVVITTKKGTK